MKINASLVVLEQDRRVIGYLERHLLADDYRPSSVLAGWIMSKENVTFEESLKKRWPDLTEALDYLNKLEGSK